MGKKFSFQNENIFWPVLFISFCEGKLMTRFSGSDGFPDSVKTTCRETATGQTCDG